jgi:hypothetical protein
VPNINQLNSVDTPSGSDLLPLFSQQNGDARQLSLNNFVRWLQNQLTVADDKVTQYSAPTTGSTLLVEDDQNSIWLVLTPAGTLSALTIKLPLQANCVDKQEILVNSTQAVTTLSFDANGSSVVGLPSTLAANGFFRLRYDAVMKTWYRVG